MKLLHFIDTRPMLKFSLLLVVVVVVVHGDVLTDAKCRDSLLEMSRPSSNTSLARAVKMRAMNGHGNYAFSPLGIVDIGSWRGCRAIDQARYCTVYSNITGLGLAACVPSTCDQTSLNSTLNTNPLLITTALGLVPFTGQPVSVSCLSRPPLPTAGKWILAFCALLVAAVVVGTLLDLQINHGLIPIGRWLGDSSADIAASAASEIPDQMSEAELLYLGAAPRQGGGARGSALRDTYDAIAHSPIFQPILAFSFVSNVKRLFAPAPPGDFSVLNGIRVLSLCWVILGHTYLGVLSTPLMNIQLLEEVLQTFRYQVIFAGMFAVDSFFLLSGFLVAYLFISQVRKHGITNWTMPIYFIHRIWRLFPSLLLMVLLVWKVVPYIATNGPTWPVIVNSIEQSCADGWWKTAIFINNFYDQSEICAPWTWYLSNDIQFYFLAPFVLIAYLQHRSVGWTLTIVLLVGSIVANIVTSIEFDLISIPFLNNIGLGLGLTAPPPPPSVIANVYFLPWTRCGPYLIGIAMAFILIEQGDRARIPAATRLIILLLASIMIVVLIFITYTQANYGWDKEAYSVLWFAASRPLWAISVGAWILFSIWGNGGPINKFLSIRLWIPFARLGFGAYLYQSVAIAVFFGSFTFPFDYSPQLMIYFWWAMIFTSFWLSLLNYILLEKPLMNIEKLFLSGRKQNNNN